jgi:phosphatidylglycerol:prolipoprotein diacylglycerol transferase
MNIFARINFGILSYSLFNSIAYALAGLLFYLEAKRKKFSLETVLYVLLAALFGGLIGSRLGSALFVYWGYYSKNFLHILMPQIGGKTLVGGLIGGYLGVVIAKRSLKFSRSTGDLFAPGLALGIAIGRIGCLFNGCCYGTASNLPWAVRFEGILRHPTQIYESVFCFFLFLYLWRIRTRIKREGDLFKIFLLLYAYFRFWIEFLRADKVGIISNLSIAQAVSGGVFVILSVYFLKRTKEV